ncbi:histidine phosphatase family protein [Streptomyces sp. NBC_00343]|uniref:histidine phosphatase family protein n=1 Tax=Streptomyces sp. NBC_00343 TaxID=2975719 RepID=UPI002E2E0B67|nr:histidine phosphatase family protein [Streptomyces sp. NBC_00343]
MAGTSRTGGRALRIYLVRHGQSEWQLAPGADLDMPLSPLGQEQSQRLADWCARGELLDASSRFDVGPILVSPLKRARQTADHLVRDLGLPVDTLPALAEAPFRVADELPRTTGPLTLPTGKSSEKYRSFQQQVGDALTELVRLATESHRPVLAVTHGGVIKTALRTIAGSDAFSATLYNCAITAVDWRDGRWHVVHVNLWDHLPPRMRTL